ncbi:MAG TPA: RHS repeat-associated core domain-containing protein [Fluviicola sp.]|nr:RHS repeat-associated core domain-containing protein [Fluviicola sp.]
MNHFFIALITMLITVGATAQVTGGRGNSEPTPKVSEPAKINAGGFSGDVNLFTGDYNATIPLGGVSTPGGLSYQLYYEYSSSFTVGATPPISTGIPYGEGWNLNIPTISIETEVFNNFSREEYCVENNPAVGTPLDFRSASPTKEGDLFWFSPYVNIPGVANGRAVFKYIDVDDNKTAVFVLNTFETQVELRYSRGGWKVITQDGTQYFFSTTIQSANAPANRRVLYYDQDNLGTSSNIAKDVMNNGYGGYKEGVANSVSPKVSYNLWYCNEISNRNIKEQNIIFVYEKFGAFNYFQEYQQEAYKTAAASVFNSTTFAADNDFTAYTDIMLKRIESHAVNSMVEQLKLNYETNKSIINNNSELLPFYNSNFDGGRMDSLYTYKIIYEDGIAGNFSSSWKRYEHLRANATTINDAINPANPYVTTSGYVRSGTGGSGKIGFDHSFLETPRLCTGNYELIPGDIYEVRSKITRSDADELEMGNGTIDISVVTGDLDNPTGSTGITTTYSGLNSNSGIYYPASDYEETRGIPLFSTFNMALKWTLSYSEGIKNTSNFFMMPNIPSNFGGLNVQIGPGNADVNCNSIPGTTANLVSSNIPDARAAYVFSNNAWEIKSAANLPGNFGVGLPWGMMIPIYKNMITVLNAVTYSSGDANDAFKFWWNYDSETYAMDNEPTKLDETVELDEFQLIRYTKNPYMLTSVEFYKVNGEINTPTNDGLKLIAKKKMEYTSKRTQILENYDYSTNDPLKYKRGSRPERQVHILLKAVRDIPIDATTDTAKFLTTFLDYSAYISADSVYDETKPLNGYKGFLLTTFTDHLGGITRIEYYPPTDTRTYYTGRFTYDVPCGSVVTAQAFGTTQASTIHPIVKYILKNDEQDLVKSGTASSNDAHKRWRYDFDASSRVYKSMDVANSDDDHFHNGRKTSYGIGFKTVSVYGPTLTDNGNDYVNKTVYEHYGYKLTSGSGSPTDEDYLLHGKIKSIKEYDVDDKLFTEKLINYGYTLAFKNGYTRPNPYKEDIQWDQDLDNPGGHYEYRDWYLNQSVSVTNVSGTFTGTAAYPYLDIPVFTGTGESKELPRFLDFYYYPMLDTANSDLLLHSYFIKKTEDISRSYDDYLSKTATSSPIVVPQVVSPLPNPFGEGLGSAVVYNHLRDSAYMYGIANLNVATMTGKLAEESPLSDTVVKALISSGRFTSAQKMKVLVNQPGLSNDVWLHILTNEASFSGSELADLTNIQPYFPDEILLEGVDVVNALDPLFFESLFLRNEYLSEQVLLALVTSGSSIDEAALVKILAAQPQMTEDVLLAILDSKNISASNFDIIFAHQVLTDDIYDLLIADGGLDNADLANILTNGMSYPNETAFLNLLVRDFTESEMERICAATNRQLESSITLQLAEQYEAASFLSELTFGGNPLTQYCNGAITSSWSYIENKTSYEYYEADYRGVAQGRAYKVLMGLEDIPGRSVSLTDFFGSGGTKTINTMNLKHEPSWQVFAATSTSVHLPDAKKEEQFFYLYDLRNRYDRYWYNYDIKTVNSEITSFDHIEIGLDTLCYTGRWDNYYGTLYGEENPEIPKYDGMTKSRQYNLRNLPYQHTTITKSQRDETAMARSEYFFYDARWKFDDFVIETDEYDGLECPPEPPVPTPTDCEQCQYWKYGQEQDLLNALPNNYCLWEDDVIGYYACPFGIDASVCFPGAELVNCNPSLAEEQLPDPQRYLQMADALGKSLQLRSTIIQLDTVMGILDTEFADKRFDRSNSYIADFYLDPETEDPEGFEGVYRMVFPFDTLTTLKVKERNVYFQPAITKNQVGIHTRYYYKKAQQYWNTNENCANSDYNFLFNYSSVDAQDIGLPIRITIGWSRPDSLSSAFEYADDGQVSKTTNPSGHYFEYTFDGYHRLISTTENGTRLLSRNAYHQWGHNSSLDFEDRTDENYVYSIQYNNYELTPSVDTSQREMQKAFVDPMGRMAGTVRAYKNNGDRKIYSGSVVYDNWGRPVETRKTFAYSSDATPINYRDNLASTLKNVAKYDHDPGSLNTRAADYGMAVTSNHTLKTSTCIVNNIYANCELELTGAELLLLMKSGSTSNFRFLRSSLIDQDDKETVTYTNAMGQKVATLAWSNLNEKIVTLFVYDNHGNLAKTINPKKQHTDYLYNILGKLVKETTIDGGSKRYLYNKLGQVSALQDQVDRDLLNGSISEPRYRKFTYDDYGRPAGQYWITTNYHQDAFLFQTSSVGDIGDYYIDAESQPHYLRYTFTNRSTMDWINNYVSLNNGDTTITPMVGLPSASTTVTEKTTTYGTNNAYPLVLGKMVETKSYNNNVAVQRVTFTYDAQERVASQIIRQHPEDETTDDDKLVVAKIEYPSYNYRGSLLEERLDIGNDASVEMLYYYRFDELNRLIEVRAVQDGATSYTNATKLVTYTYDDALGRVAVAKYSVENGSNVSEDAQTIIYSFDDKERLTQIGSELFDYKLYYDDAVVPGYNNSIQQQQNYNGNINGIQAKYTFEDATNYVSTSGLFQYATNYGYKYDRLNRLVQADATVGDFVEAHYANVSNGYPEDSYRIGDEKMTYDKIGNLTSLLRVKVGSTMDLGLTYDDFLYEYESGNNRLEMVNGQNGTTDRNYSYNTNGNLLTDDFRGIDATNYVRGSYASMVDMNSLGDLTYLYDAADMRFYKKRENPGDIVEESYIKDALGRDLAILTFTTIDDDLDITAEYFVFGHERIARVISRGVGSPPERIYSNEATFFLYDHLGNTRVAFQHSTANPAVPSTIMNAMDYYPYGKVLREFDTGDGDRYLTTSNERDEETGLDYRGARYYDSDVARFLSTDPWANKYPSWSTYNYVMGNPMILTDPIGKGPTDDYFDIYGRYLFSTNTKERTIIIQDQTNNYKCTQLKNFVFTKQNAQTLSLIAAHYARESGADFSKIKGKRVGISNSTVVKVDGQLLVQSTSWYNGGMGDGVDALMNYDEETNTINIPLEDGKINPLLNNAWNFISTLGHEYDHKLVKREEDLLVLEHIEVYYNQMTDEIYSKTTQAFKNAMLKNARGDMHDGLNFENNINNSITNFSNEQIEKIKKEAQEWYKKYEKAGIKL